MGWILSDDIWIKIENNDKHCRILFAPSGEQPRFLKPGKWTLASSNDDQIQDAYNQFQLKMVRGSQLCENFLSSAFKQRVHEQHRF